MKKILSILSILALMTCDKKQEHILTDLEKLGMTSSIYEVTYNYKWEKNSPFESYHTFYRFNNDGRIVEERYYDLNKQSSIKKYLNYDKANRLINWTEYKEDGTFFKKKAILYDNLESSKIKQTTLFNVNDEPYLISDYEYSSKDQILEIEANSNYIENFTQYIKFDENGNEILISKTYENGENLGHIKKEYDSKQRIKKQVYLDTEDNISSISRMEYDGSGALVKKLVTNKDGKTLLNITISYDYDLRGNWFKAWCFTDGERAYIIERDIKYRFE